MNYLSDFSSVLHDCASLTALQIMHKSFEKIGDMWLTKWSDL